MRPAPPLLVLLPALVLVPVLLMLPQLLHGGGWDLIGQFAWAALTPATAPCPLTHLTPPTNLPAVDSVGACALNKKKT